MQYSTCPDKNEEELKENLDNNFIVGAVLTDLFKTFDCIPHDLFIVFK